MKWKLFAAFDTEMGCFLNPFTASERGIAVREMMRAVIHKHGDVGAHPEKFNLLELGEFDDESGVLTALEKGPQLVITGAQISAANKEE